LDPKYGICFLAASGTMRGKGDYIALAPPYNVTEQDLHIMVDRTDCVIQDFFGN